MCNYRIVILATELISLGMLVHAASLHVISMLVYILFSLAVIAFTDEQTEIKLQQMNHQRLSFCTSCYWHSGINFLMNEFIHFSVSRGTSNVK